MKVYIWTGRGWKCMGDIVDNYVAMIVNSLNTTHPNMHFAYGTEPPKDAPRRENRG